MNISDIRTRVDKTSLLVTRSAEPEKTPVLNVIETAHAGRMSDPLIQALVDKLPEPNSVWSIDDRAKWLKAAAMAFNLVYRFPASEDLKQSVLKSVG